MAYNGYFWSVSGRQIYGTPRESPGKYRPRPIINREVKRSISQYDHAELVSLSTSICCRIPVLRAAIRDKNAWAFSNWLPIYMGENEAWGEAAEDWLRHEVFPNAMFRELRGDLAWGMRVSGMGLDMQGDDLAVFTEDEYHNPKIDFVPSPRIGSGLVGAGWVSSIFSGTHTTGRPDGMGVVNEGEFKGLPIYNGIIRQNGRPIAARVLGYNDQGEAIFSDFRLGTAFGTNYACEMEFFGQGRGIPRPSASVLQWMKKENIDDQFLKGLENAAERTVIHKLAPGQDAAMARGNAIQETIQMVPTIDASGKVVTDGNGNIVEEQKSFYVEKSPDGQIAYIGSDEDLTGMDYKNPHPNGEAFVVRVAVECLSDVGWSWALMDTSQTSRAPTRLETNKANNSISERQGTQEIRSVQFIQHAIALGMEYGRIPKNDAGIDPYKWSIGFSAQMSVDQGNDVTAALNRLKMGLTNERIEAAKDGYVSKHIRKQRLKEVREIMTAADNALKFAQGLGHSDFTFQQAMELFYQPNPNSSANMSIQEQVEDPAQPGVKPTQPK